MQTIQATALAALFVVAPLGAQDQGVVEVVDLPGVVNPHRVGRLLLAGQPTAAALERLAAGGLDLVIDLRQPGEVTDFDEPALLERLGVAHANPAFRAPGELTDDVFGQVRTLLRDHADADVMLHCGSANRVGAVWLAARVLDQNVPWSQALEEAHVVGLSFEGYETRARHYVLGGGNVAWGELLERVRRDHPEVRHITVKELGVRMTDYGTPPFLIDVRTPAEYGVSHLYGAARAASREEALALLGEDARDREIVVYCSVGVRSSQLAHELSKEGFTNVRNLEGSIFAWANAGRRVYRGHQLVTVVHPYSEKWGRFLNADLRAPLPTDRSTERDQAK